MHHRTNATLHLSKLLSLLWVFNESTITDDLSILAKVLDKHVIGSSDALPSLLGHSGVEGLSKLQADFISNALTIESFLESVEMGHLVFDELQSAFGPETAGPQRVAGVGMRPKLTTLRIA